MLKEPPHALQLHTTRSDPYTLPLDQTWFWSTGKYREISFDLPMLPLHAATECCPKALLQPTAAHAAGPYLRSAHPRLRVLGAAALLPAAALRPGLACRSEAMPRRRPRRPPGPPSPTMCGGALSGCWRLPRAGASAEPGQVLPTVVYNRPYRYPLALARVVRLSENGTGHMKSRRRVEQPLRFWSLFTLETISDRSLT